MTKKCFMVQPFDGGKFDKRFDDVFAPAVKDAGLEPYRVDRDAGAGIPIVDIERGIRDAVAVFVDITTDNPNVWFELGYAIAAGKDLCIVCSKERSGSFPFDIQHRKIISYAPESTSDFQKLKTSITERLRAIISQQDARADIRAITKETATAGLADYEAAALACIAAEAEGVEDSVSNWVLRQEMEKAGFNNLACKVAVRRLLEKGFITVEKQNDEWNRQYETYHLSEMGWRWISSNTHMLNLRVQPKPRDDEIPF